VVLSCAAQIGSLPGIGQSPIIGGDQASIQDAPWQAALLYGGSIRCGGSIISSTAILTAAHCTYGMGSGLWNVRVGSSNHASGGRVLGVAKIVSHPQYDTMSHDYDIAVITLASAVSIDNINTKVIPLPYNGQLVPGGSPALVTGWGSTLVGGAISSILRKVTIPVVDKQKCTQAYDGSNIITDRMLCGGLLGVGGADACQGDSGGPFVVGGVLVGVTSWGRSCALADYPGIWTRVPVLVNWILTQM